MKKLKMKLTGAFSLTDGTVILTEKDIHSRKLLYLMIYILVYRDQILMHQQLIDQFWENNSKNPKSALKNQIHLLRNTMKIFGEEQYICTLPGGYRWNPGIEVEADYEQLQSLVDALKKEMPDEKKRVLCEQIVERYGDTFTELLSDEMWIAAQKVNYRTGYLSAAKQLGTMLEKEQEWEKLEHLCCKVIKLDDKDEDIQCWLMKAFQGQKKYDQVIVQYEKMKQNHCEERGMAYFMKMQEIYQQIVLSKEISDIQTVKKMLEEPPVSEDIGSYFCDYEIFKQIYRLEARRIERLGIAEYVVLFTLERVRKRKTQVENDPLLIEGMDFLENAVRNCLRSGDVGARCNESQSIVLLPTCTYETVIKVAERVAIAFQKQYKRKKLEIYYEVAEIAVSA